VSVASMLFERYRPVEHWMTRYSSRSIRKKSPYRSIRKPARCWDSRIPFRKTAPVRILRRIKRVRSPRPCRGRGLGPGCHDLKENTSEKKKARRDYTLEWEARPGDPRNLDEAHYRVHIEVAGDRVSSLRSYWKIPEAYERSRQRQNALSIVVLALRIG